MGSQGKVIADITGDRGIVAAWTMMRRGCRVLAEGEGDENVLRMYDPGLRRITGEETPGFMREIMAKVNGAFIDDLGTISQEDSGLPVFCPTIGMTDSETCDMLERIRTVSF